MKDRINRRTALGLGTAAMAGAISAAGIAWAYESTERGSTSASPAITAQEAATRVRDVYQEESTKAGGTWSSCISLTDTDGGLVNAVQDGPHTVVQAYSVNKVAVATVLLDKVDRGLLTLDQRADVTADIVVPGGDGIFSLDGAYPSSVTLGHVLAALLTISDDTAARLCGLFITSAEINSVLMAKGFSHTQVDPLPDPHRFYLGTTSPRETRDLLQGLLSGTVVSPSSGSYLFGLLRSPIAFTDGIRRTMSSRERARIATKAGWLEDGRNEAGVMFDVFGRPVLTYSLFCSGISAADNFGATDPAVQARSIMGRKFLDIIDKLAGPSATPGHQAPGRR